MASIEKGGAHGNPRGSKSHNRSSGNPPLGEERGGRPACVKGTGNKGDIGMLRLDFPGYSGGKSLQPISWDDWFKKFDERGLALLHQEKTARGQQSNFNKLVSRQTAQRTTGSRSAKRRPEKIAQTARRSEPAAQRRGPSRVTKKAARRTATGKASRKAGRTTARKGTTTHRRAA
jgi:hypothetical protein